MNEGNLQKVKVTVGKYGSREVKVTMDDLIPFTQHVVRIYEAWIDGKLDSSFNAMKEIEDLIDAYL